MQVLKTSLPGTLIIQPDIFKDSRGFFMETFHREKYAAKGLDHPFVQDNLSYSTHGTLRGLHYQYPNAQAKLVQALKGEVYDVAVDIRQGSPYFGKWVGAVLSEENQQQLYVPPGFAHGFCTLSEQADFLYKCTDLYAPGDEYGIAWDDPDIAIEWPEIDCLLSEKDLGNPKLSESDHLPEYEAR